MEENKQDINKNQNITNQEPVYSQMSLDYVAGQVKKAKNKGMLQGMLISLVIVLLICGAYLFISIVGMISDGSIYAKFLGSYGQKVLDRETINKVDSISKIIGNTYIEEVDSDAIRDGIYKGMLEALEDPYSVYYTKEEYEDMMESSSGVFEGIGAYLQQDPDTMVVTVVRPIKGSPAEEVGLLAEDKIVEVDGEDISGQDLNLVVSKVRGEKGTIVNIGIRRKGEDDILYFDIKRASVDVESVESEILDDEIGYIHITEFADATDKQFIEQFDELLEKDISSLIIDLRSNGGGYVDTSVAIAQRLIDGGDIVSLKDRNGKGMTYKDEDDKCLEIPCVILVDGNTASASEILTGAIKDHELATIIGTKTFGKGIVQDVIPLGDGSGIKVTNSKYYTPNGENIHKIGITPDIIVPWDYEMYKDEGVDNQLEAAKQYLTKGKIDKKYIPEIEEDEEE